MALLLTKYGFRFYDKTQHLDNNMIVFKSDVLAGDPQPRTPDSYAMHCLSSLEELNTLQIGKEKYEEIRHNAQQVAKKIRSGYFLEKAVKEALKF